MIIQICVGSSCHLKGSQRMVELFKEAIVEYRLEDEVTLAGCFCTGQCNRVGVTVTVNDDVYSGVLPEKFDEFFKENVLKALEEERAKFNGLSDSKKI